MKKQFMPMAISALVVASMFANEGRPGFSLGNGMRFAPEDKGGGGGSDSDSKDNEEEDKEDKENEEEEKEPEGLTDAHKSWFTKQLEKQKSDTEALIQKAKDDARAEAATEAENKRKAEERKTQQKKAKDEGNVAEQLRLAREEAKEEARKDHEAELQKVKDEASKVRIAAEHKLPKGWHERLLGKNEKEWERDAAELAKGRPSSATRPDLEGGGKDTSTKEEQNKIAAKRARSLVPGI